MTLTLIQTLTLTKLRTCQTCGERLRRGYFHQHSKKPGVIARLLKDESGQTLAEYAILAGLIALVTIGTLHVMGEGMRGTLQYIADELQKPY